MFRAGVPFVAGVHNGGAYFFDIGDQLQLPTSEALHPLLPTGLSDGMKVVVAAVGRQLVENGCSHCSLGMNWASGGLEPECLTAGRLQPRTAQTFNGIHATATFRGQPWTALISTASTPQPLLFIFQAPKWAILRATSTATEPQCVYFEGSVALGKMPSTADPVLINKSNQNGLARELGRSCRRADPKVAWCSRCTKPVFPEHEAHGSAVGARFAKTNVLLNVSVSAGWAASMCCPVWKCNDVEGRCLHLLFICDEAFVVCDSCIGYSGTNVWSEYVDAVRVQGYAWLRRRGCLDSVWCPLMWPWLNGVLGCVDVHGRS